MAVDNEDVLAFAERMQSDLIINPEKADWKKAKDPWWYFSQLAKSVNSMEDAMTNQREVDELAIDIANYSLIIFNLYKIPPPPKKKKAAKKVVVKKKIDKNTYAKKVIVKRPGPKAAK